MSVLTAEQIADIADTDWNNLSKVHIYNLVETAKKLTERLEASERRVKELEVWSLKTICSYCGEVSEVELPDIELKRKAALEHILKCDKRPENQLINAGIDQERKIKELDRELAELRQHGPCGLRAALVRAAVDEIVVATGPTGGWLVSPKQLKEAIEAALNQPSGGGA